MDHLIEKIKAAGDVAAGSTAVATVLGWMPAISAFLAALYTIYRIYDLWETRRKERNTGVPRNHRRKE